MKFFYLLIFFTVQIVSSLAYSNDWGRNPFHMGAEKESIIPLNTKDESQALRLIVIYGQKKIALFANMKYSVGDAVNGEIITDISIDSVTTLINGVAKIYRLGE